MKISVGNYPVIVGKGLWGLPGTGYGRLLDTFRTARETLAETAEVRLFGMHTRVTCRIEISQEKVAHPPKGSPPQAGDPVLGTAGLAVAWQWQNGFTLPSRLV